MNKDTFEINWKEIRSHTPAWWSLMGDHDLLKVDKADVKLDKYVTMLRVKYGYSNEEAKKEIAKRLAGFESVKKSNNWFAPSGMMLMPQGA